MSLTTIGIDLGGTKIEGIRLGPDNTVQFRKRIPTLREEGYAAIVDRLIGLIHECQGSDHSLPVGIGTPGAISPKTGRIKNSNTVCLIGQPLKEDLEDRLGQGVVMENDANCFGLAEALLGAGRGDDLVFGVIMGTGVGGGIIYKGNILSGRSQGAGEWGHTILHPGGHSCYCGRQGCVETYLSGPALERAWAASTGITATLPEILSSYETHPRFQAWKQDFLNNFGMALGNIINLLDPHVVILGGGVSNIDWLYTEGREAVYRHCFTDKPDTPIRKHELGDSAGALGAALLARTLI